MKKKHAGGRPKAITDAEVQKLKQGFMQGFNDMEACLYADVKKTTFYDYCKENPEFSDLKEQLKRSPLIKAKLNINEALQQKDKDISKWYLERKAKDEFSTKSEVSSMGEVRHILVATERDKLALEDNYAIE